MHRSLATAVATVALTAGSLAAQPFADLSSWTMLAGSGLITPESVNLTTAALATLGCAFAVSGDNFCSAARSPRFATSGGTLSFAVRFNSEEPPTAPSSNALVAVVAPGPGIQQFPVLLRSRNLVGGTSGILTFSLLLEEGIYEITAVLERPPASTRASSLVLTNVVLPPTPSVPTTVPEPATLALVGAGLLAVGGAARRRGRAR